MSTPTLMAAQPKKNLPPLTAGLLTGLLVALLPGLLPVQVAAKYLAALGAAVLIWQRPAAGLYLFLAGLAFLPTLSAGELLLAVAAIWALRRLLAGERVLAATGVELPLFAFMFFVLMGVAFSVTRRASLGVLPLYALDFLAFYLMAVLPRPKEAGWLLGGLLLAGALTGLLALAQYRSGVQTSLSWIDARQAEDIKTRVFSTFDNPNIFAEYLTFVLPPVLVFFLRERRWGARLVWLLVLACAGAGLILTFSRGGWLAVGLALVVLGILWDRRLLLLVAVGLVLLPLAAPGQVLTRAASIGSLEDSSNTFRLSIWLAVLRMIAAYWSTGIGLGSAAFNQVYPQFMLAGTPAMHSHNLYLQLALELGVPGLVAFLWLLGAVAARALSALPRLAGRRQGLLAALLASLAGFLLHGAVDNVWYSPKLTLLFWAALGLVLALGREAGGPARTARGE
ncbi:MAG TPA: hypothetical protein GXX50_07725 [Firmicutes bacterium]|nr:hypothetical protein [Bacillota bacterium]